MRISRDLPGGDSVFTSGNPPSSTGGPVGVQAWEQNLSFSYSPHSPTNTAERSGTYYTVNGEAGVQSTGNRPILPQTTVNFGSTTEIARGVLMQGGTFTDESNNPVISHIIDQEADLANENIYLTQSLYPVSPASLNRFTTVGGYSQQRLIVVPAQFQTTSITAPTSGILRKYSTLDLIVYTAPFTNLDFDAPVIWSVEAAPNAGNIDFTVKISDALSDIHRTVILYRTLNTNSWTMLDLTFDSQTGLATGSAPDPSATLEYFVQAVDGSGNVSLVLDHGVPFRVLSALTDTDGDNVSDDIDNCLFTANSDQADFDQDGLGDACDPNADNDPLVDVFDAQTFNDAEWLDLDNDGTPDNTDTDSDNDGVSNAADNCPYLANADQADANNNGVGDACDPVPPANSAPVLDPIADQTLPGAGTVSFTATANDANAGDTLVFSIFGKPDGASFNENTGYFSWTATLQQRGVYTVTVCVSDNKDNDCQQVTVTIGSDSTPPVTNAGGPYTGNEGAGIILNDASAVDDLNQSSVVVSWSINSAQCSFADANVIHPTLTCQDNGSFIATLTATDSINPSVSSNATVTVSNVAPTLGPINIPVSLNPINTTILANASFTDPGSLDTHTATWDWGDGTTSAGTINETAGNGTASASHTYTVAGVYNVTLKITDKDVAVSNLSEFQFVVIYDPNGGFVTGGGQINSPAGALVAQPNVTGRGTFGFNAKYQRNGRLHSELEFELQGADFHFHAQEAQWLVINGAQDALFQQDGVKASFEKLHACYCKAGVPDRCRTRLYDSPHEFNEAMQTEAWDWLNRWI